MELKLTNVNVDLIAKRANLQLSAAEPGHFGFVNAQFAIELPPELAAAQLERHAREHAKQFLQQAIAALG